MYMFPLSVIVLKNDSPVYLAKDNKRINFKKMCYYKKQLTIAPKALIILMFKEWPGRP